jgi:F0F1-type ATP synthase delta subunit
VFGLEGRYATALFSAASKQKQLDVVEKELVKFKVCCVLTHSLLGILHLCRTLHFIVLVELDSY